MVENAISEDTDSLIRMTFEQGDLKKLRVQAMEMSRGREFQTEGTAKRTVRGIVPGSKGERV